MHNPRLPSLALLFAAAILPATGAQARVTPERLTQQLAEAEVKLENAVEDCEPVDADQLNALLAEAQDHVDAGETARAMGAPYDRATLVANLAKATSLITRARLASAFCEQVPEADPKLARILDIHNEERLGADATGLIWNPQLANNAAGYARVLAQRQELVHSPREGRGLERENLQQVIPGWSADQMMEGWLSEKEFFVPGLFPAVSTTGDWNVVSHFSQMLWPGTRELGCGIAAGGGFEWLVCRYLPGGNRPGEWVGLAPEPAEGPIITPPPPPVIVYFPWGSAELSEAARRQLDEAADDQRRTGEANVVLAGHADHSGSGSYDQGLAREREQTVHAYLTAKGVPADSIASSGFGDAPPAPPTGPRVDITFGPGSGW
jgi:flagellar motor protein MotB